MKFNETTLPGVFLIDLELASDDRGFFARGWCKKEFADHGLTAEISQVNISQNHHAGTLRGLHMQSEPHAEATLVRCSRGSIFDVAVDMRESSSTYLQWTGHELSAENRSALFIPKGFAHGYQTLTDDSEVFYLISEFYAPGLEAGFHHADPKIGIEWPAAVNVISEKDANCPYL
jgi:dTDP-4-dehydrorhamnose 3,5-epimerase